MTENQPPWFAIRWFDHSSHFIHIFNHISRNLQSQIFSGFSHQMPQFDLYSQCAETNFVSSSHISLAPLSQSRQYFGSQPAERPQNFLFQSPETSAQAPERNLLKRPWTWWPCWNMEHKNVCFKSIMRAAVNNMKRLTRWGELTNDRSEVKLIDRDRQPLSWLKKPSISDKPKYFWGKVQIGQKPVP